MRGVVEINRHLPWNQIDAKSFRGVKLVGKKAAAVCHVDRTRGSGPGHRIVTSVETTQMRLFLLIYFCY